MKIEGCQSGGSATRGRNMDKRTQKALKKRQGDRKFTEQLSEFEQLLRKLTHG